MTLATLSPLIWFLTVILQDVNVVFAFGGLIGAAAAILALVRWINDRQGSRHPQNQPTPRETR
jgi:hypothetical protein